MTKIEAVYPLVSQFEHGETAYACGFFTVALQKAAGQHSPQLTAEQVDQLADKLYTQYDGSDSSANTNGMSRPDWYLCLEEEHIAYHNVDLTIPAIANEINAGRAVCVTVSEPSVFDVDLGDHVPYAWKPSGNHIFTIVGAEPGVWLVNDQANIGPGGVRPWPRRYNAGKLSISLATAIDFPWLSQEAPPTPPTPPPPPQRTYTVQEGNYLGEIAAQHGVWPPSKLYQANAATIENAAHEHGHASSNNGNLIFPGTVLVIP